MLRVDKRLLSSCPVLAMQRTHRVMNYMYLKCLKVQFLFVVAGHFTLF